jgi:HEAT repeat protein
MTAAQAFRPLVRLLDDAEPEVRAEALRSLARLGESVADALARQVLAADEPLRDMTAEALTLIGSPATHAVRALARQVKPSDRDVLAGLLARSVDHRALVGALALGAAGEVRGRSRRT